MFDPCQIVTLAMQPGTRKLIGQTAKSCEMERERERECHGCVKVYRGGGYEL